MGRSLTTPAITIEIFPLKTLTAALKPVTPLALGRWGYAPSAQRRVGEAADFIRAVGQRSRECDQPL